MNKYQEWAFAAVAFNTVFAETPPAPVPPAPIPPVPAPVPPAPVPPVPPEPVSFTQDQMNTKLAEQKRIHQAQTQTAIDELNALKAKSTLSQQDRLDLDGRITDLQNQLLTKEEQSKREKDKSDKEYGDKLKASDTKYDKLWGNYKTESISRTITDAAVVEEAISPSQIVALLDRHSELVPVMNEETQEPTGTFKVVVKFPDVDKDKNPVIMEFTPAEAVKRMKELEQYFNLFKGEGTGGVGGQNRPTTLGSSDPAKLAAENPDKYIADRRSGKLKLE